MTLKNFLKDYIFRPQDRFDAPRREGSVRVPGFTWLDDVHPVGSAYRILTDEMGALYLETLVGEQWMTVERYNHGYFDGDKIYAAHWEPVTCVCAWNIKGLRDLVRVLEGKPRTKVVMEEIGVA